LEIEKFIANFFGGMIIGKLWWLQNNDEFKFFWWFQALNYFFNIQNNL